MEKNDILAKVPDVHWLKTMLGSVAEDHCVKANLDLDGGGVSVAHPPKWEGNAATAVMGFNEELEPLGLKLAEVSWLRSATSRVYKFVASEN